MAQPEYNHFNDLRATSFRFLKLCGEKPAPTLKH
jgi:hypothetical protein